MTSLSNVNRSDVLSAIALCDHIGEELFLELHGYRQSKTWRIRYQGETYPSKAILGVAAGLRARDFFGGVAQTVPALERLGFEVRKGERKVSASELEELAAAVQFDDLDPGHELEHEPAAYFHSGSNRPGEIRGLAARSKDIGVAVKELDEPALAELERLAGTDVRVFVDSGAFSEFMGKGTPDWTRVLDVYLRLGRALGDQVWVVAPDKIGDQAATLERLAAHVPMLRLIAATGARVLVPVQKGEVCQVEFAKAVDRVLCGIAWTEALPCNAAATTPEEVRAFVRERKPAHVHMLGLGPRRRPGKGSPYWARDYVEALGGTSYSMDSSWLAASTGRKSGKGSKRRRYSAARDLAHVLLAGAGLVATAGAVAELGMLIVFGGVA